MASNAIRRSPEWLSEHQARLANRRPAAPVQAAAPGVDVARLVRADAALRKFQAKGRLPKGTMNKTEAAYAELLEEQKRMGMVLWWKFHPLRVRLADNAFYEVDFLVMAGDGGLEIHETKGGYVTDKGQLKIRLCAEALPVFRMFKMSKLSKKDGGGWKKEEF